MQNPGDDSQPPQSDPVPPAANPPPSEPPVVPPSPPQRNPALNFWRIPEEGFPLSTFALILLSVVATGLAQFFPERVYQSLHASGVEIFQDWKWWALVTSIFLHVGFLHLFFNCCWTWILGRSLEPDVGPFRYLGLILAAAWVGSVAEFAVDGDVGVGLSGVVYAFFGFMLVNRSRRLEYALILNRDNIILMVGWLIVCFPLTYMGTMRVANFAHLGGLVTGCVLGWASFPGRWRNAARVGLAILIVATIVPLFWAPWSGAWQMLQLQRDMENRNEDAMLVRTGWMRQHYPDYEWAYYLEADIRMRRRQYPEARELLANVAATTKNPQILNALAWLLAVCPDDKIRDGNRAIGYAERACAATQWRDSGLIDTLAAAHAEAGNFAEAVKWSEKSQADAGEHAKELKEHLDAFRAGKPWREDLGAANDAAKEKKK